MTANNIRSKSFETERNGYSQAEVNSFMAELAQEFSRLTAENEENDQKISKLVDKVNQYRADEDAIKDALLSAQKEAGKIINDAKNKANAMIESAKSEQMKLAEQSASECEKIVREHKERCAQLIKENTEITEKKISALRTAYDEEKAAYDELRAEVTYFKSNLTALYQEQIKLVMELPTLTDDELDEYEASLEEEEEYYEDEEGEEEYYEEQAQEADEEANDEESAASDIDKVLGNTGSFEPVIPKTDPSDLQFGKNN